MVYVEQPLSFETHNRESHVCILNKSLYGLKQAPRTWYNKIDSFLSSLGFTKSKADSKLCSKVEGRRPVMLLLYVNDLFLIGKGELIKDARRRLATEFEIKDFGMVLSRHGDVVECRWNLLGTRELCNRDLEEV